jgi:hypothetical protein
MNPENKWSNRNTKKFWAHPAAKDRNSDGLFDQTDGHVRNQDEIIASRKKKGKCPQCGIVKTHKRGVFGVGLTKDTRVGQVYKGICLQCNTLYQAKLKLGEPVDVNLDRGSVLEALQIRSNAAAAVAAAASGLSPIRDRRSSSIRQSDEISGAASQSRSHSRQESNSNQSSSWSGSNHIIPPPIPFHHHPQDETVPQEINERLDMPRRFSEISIPPEFQDFTNERSSNGSDYRENSVGTVGTINLMGILEEEQHRWHQSFENVTLGTSPTSTGQQQTSPTSMGQQSRGFMSSDGTTTTNTTTTYRRPSSPGVEHFDGASSSGDRLYQRIRDKASQKKPPAAATAPAAATSRSSPSSSANSSSATSVMASTTNHYNRSYSDNNNCTMLPPSSPTSPSQSLPSSPTSPARSILTIDQHTLDSHGAISALSASDQLEARRQKKINEADTRKGSLQSANDAFDRRLLSKAEGGGGDEDSTPGARHATGKDRIYHRKGADMNQEDRIYHRKGADSNQEDRIYHRKSVDWDQEESKRNESKPGVTHSTGKGSSLYDRKMGDEGKSRAVNYVGDEEVEEEKYQLDDTLARELIGSFTSCSELFDFLKRNSPLPAPSMIQTLIRMRDLLPPPSEMSFLRSSSISSATSGGSDNTNKFLPSDWPNRLFDAVSDHPSDKVVQAEGLRTMWTIISTNNHFASDLTSYAAKKDILRAMETHKKSSLIQGYGASLLACIASTEKYALQLLNSNDGKFIKRLMDALKVHYDDGDDHYLNGSVQENSLKALYHLSSASLASSRPMVFFGKKMGQYAGIASAENNPSLHAVEAVLHAMELQLKNVSVQIFGNKLLYNIFSFDEIDDEERCDKWISKYLPYAMAAKTYHLKSRPFCESIMCFLSKISGRGGASLDGNLFPGIIADIMSSSDSSLVAQHGCRCFHNVCARDSESASTSQDVAASVDGISIIISCMTAFKEHQSIQSEACLSLVALCANSSKNKAIVLEQGGIEVIFSAYLSYGSSKIYEGVGLKTKIRACAALISLALYPASKIEMNRIGIIEKFDCILREDEKMPQELSRLIKRLLVLTSDEEGDDWLLEFRDGASEDETVVCVLANLRMITQADDDHQIDTSSLITNLLWAMRRFANSRVILENANKALACLYSSNQGQARAEHIYTDVLEAVEVSLREHQNYHNVVAAACSVIKNICITCLTPAGVEPSQILLDALYRFILEVVNAMELCIDDITAVEQASGALWAMCNSKPSLVVSLGTINPGKSNTINVLTNAMKQFPSSIELHRNAIGVMHLFFIQSNNIIKDERSIACVVDVASVLANFMKDSEGDEGVTDTALQILKVLADERGHDAKIAISESEDIIAAIVSCMFSYPNSLIILGKACDILRSLAVNNLKRSQICHQGGTTRIIDALRRMKTDPIFVCKAFMALENLISGADIDVLAANDAATVLLNAIEALPQSINVQVHGANVIWHLSSRQNLFKEALVRQGAARLISEAMARFLPSQEMQQKGCIAIWSISTQKALKVDVGHYAIVPIIDGVSAHCSPDDLSSSSQGDKQKFCEDALGAVKCLSTATTNKRLLEENGAIDLICGMLWLHGDNADLCQSALSALSNICVDIETKQVLRISSDVLDVLVHTMLTHQYKKEVQSIAIILLRNFTFSPSNVLILQRNKLVSKLVNNAMVNFNTNFQGRAEDVLRVLPSLLNQ